MSIENATVEELQQALVEKKNAEKVIARRILAELFVENGLQEFLNVVNSQDSVEGAYKIANNFTSKYVRVRKVLGIPVGKRGRKQK